MDTHGVILKSDLNAKSTINGVDLVGTKIDEHLENGDAKHFMDCIGYALAMGLDFCAYSIMNHVFLARMERISSRRLRVIDVDVTGLSKRLKDVFNLF